MPIPITAATNDADAIASALSNLLAICQPPAGSYPKAKNSMNCPRNWQNVPTNFKMPSKVLLPRSYSGTDKLLYNDAERGTENEHYKVSRTEKPRSVL